MNKEHARNMRRARYRANLTQSQLAEKSGVNWATIQLWESATGNPSLKAIELACKALNISISEYIYGASKTPCAPSGGLVGGQRMKVCRILKHYTMCGLADKTGLSVSAIRSYETGRMMPTLSNLEKICDVLGTTTDYLLGIGEVNVTSAKINSIQRGLSKLDDKDLERAEGILRLAFTEAFGGE